MYLFYFQFISGFVSFLYPGISAQYRQAIMPYHIYFGVLNFALAIATSILGFGEKLIFVLYVFCFLLFSILLKIHYYNCFHFGFVGK